MIAEGGGEDLNSVKNFNYKIKLVIVTIENNQKVGNKKHLIHQCLSGIRCAVLTGLVCIQAHSQQCG